MLICKTMLIVVGAGHLPRGGLDECVVDRRPERVLELAGRKL
jgi:hypothetical protein